MLEGSSYSCAKSTDQCIRQYDTITASPSFTQILNHDLCFLNWKRTVSYSTSMDDLPRCPTSLRRTPRTHPRIIQPAQSSPMPFLEANVSKLDDKYFKETTKRASILLKKVYTHCVMWIMNSSGYIKNTIWKMQREHLKDLPFFLVVKLLWGTEKPLQQTEKRTNSNETIIEERYLNWEYLFLADSTF